MENKEENKERQKLNRYGVRGILLWYFMIFAAFITLLICSGKTDWLNAWIYLIVSIVYTTIIFIVLGIINPEMVNERGKLGKQGTKPFDKVFYTLWMPLVLLSMLIIAWDAVRFQWTFMPLWIMILGVIITIPAFILGLSAMLSNPYFELTVRIQEDRNHKVITTGAYKIVRHPGYAGEIINLIATPLILGSIWGFIPIGIIIIIFIIRTALEDRTLRNELPGYEQYAKKTRYRLFPYIW